MPSQNTLLSVEEQICFSTVRIECDKPSGLATGTGFIFKFGPHRGKGLPAIVTNKHVVDGAVAIRFHMHERTDSNIACPLPYQAGPLPHRSVEFEEVKKLWLPHPDQDVDLCIAPIGHIAARAEQQGSPLFYSAFTRSLLATEKDFDEIGPFEELLMVGYPNGLWDETNNMPIVRRGVTASHPSLDYNGKPEFVIDAACFPGSSGSPVLLHNSGTYRDRMGTTIVGNRTKLLGVLYSGPQMMDTGEIVMMESPAPRKPVPVFHQPINLGYVLKSTLLADFDEEILRVSPPPVS